jgi:hypothetical protein
MTNPVEITRAFHSDDIVVWPDGCWATLGEVRNGEHVNRSDDYEIVRINDVTRLTELGIAEEMDLC